jgi:dTDP-4-amino-4,6-dideoxygalactose transaminase
VGLPEHLDQRVVMQSMLEAGVSTRRGIMCSHREVACADLPRRHALPNSERAQDRRVLLPLYPGLSLAEQQHIAQSLIDACSRAASVSPSAAAA